MDRPLRIAQVAPPLERVPPEGYGGTERVMYELIVELVRRGHDVTTFASGDSDVPGRHVPTVPVALRPADFKDDPMGYFLTTMHAVLDQRGRLRPHPQPPRMVEPHPARGPRGCRSSPRSTAGSTSVVARAPRLADAGVARRDQQLPGVAHPDIDWTVVHNGLSLATRRSTAARSDALCFVGRVAREKGIVEAIEIAGIAGRPLRIAAKVAPTGAEREFHDEVFAPALKAAGSSVEFLGEVTGAERDELFAGSYAALMPGSWPEPFGLAAIEALACGTPVLARRVGGLPEIIRDGVDGFFGDDATELAYFVTGVESLDRRAIRKSVIERFSATRMADGYEALYRRVLGGQSNGDNRRLVDLKKLAPAQPHKAG